MIGSKRDVDVAQLEYHVVIHTNPHTLFMKKEEEKPNFITAIMKQLSLKAGLKQWGTKSRNAVHSNMKKLYFIITFKPMNWKELDDTKRKSVL